MGTGGGVLANMVVERRLLVDELIIIVNRIQCLHRGDPMRATEEQELVKVLRRERRRSTAGGSVIPSA